MKQVTNRKLYDKEQADRIAQYCPIANPQDINYLNEELYKTDDGEYFLFAVTGQDINWGERYVVNLSESGEIVPITDEEAVDWCEERQIDSEIILDEFEHLIDT